MLVKETKIIDKDVLSPWILDTLCTKYVLGADVRISARAAKILRFVTTTSRAHFTCAMSDSNLSFYAVITQDAIKKFERDSRGRVTQYTVNTIVVIDRIRLKWLSPTRFAELFQGSRVPKLNCHSYGVLFIDDLEILDPDQEPLSVVLDSVYQTARYNEVVRPIVVPDSDEDGFTI